MVLGAAPVLGDDLQLALELGGELVGVGQLVLGEQTGLDALGELDLLLGVEQRDLADLLEVVLDRVGRGAGGGDLLGRRVVLVLVGQDEAGVLGASGSSPLGAASSRTSSSTSSASSFLAAVFLAAVFFAGAVVFFAAAFLAVVVFLAAAFLAGAVSSSVTSSAAEATGAAEVVAVAFLVVTVFAATVLVAVRLAGLFAATLFRVRLGSAALTISVTPSSSRIWLRLRSTFFH